jgi:phosphatidylglycerophosphatase A
MGSIVGVALVYACKGSVFFLIPAACILYVLGVAMGRRAQGIFRKQDPSCVVIDEVAGMLLSCIAIPADIRWIAAAFVLFRIFDIVKPFPARAAERLPGGWGIMTDDVIAGIYANLCVQVVIRVCA